MKAWVVAMVATMAAGSALAQTPTWDRGRDGRFEIAATALGPGTNLGFFCSAYQVPNTALITFSNLTLGTQLPDGKNFDLRFVIDGVKYELPGIAKDGELLVSPHDANMEFRLQELTEALRVGKSAMIAVPAKGWKSPLSLDGANWALDGIFEKCL